MQSRCKGYDGSEGVIAVRMDGAVNSHVPAGALADKKLLDGKGIDAREEQETEHGHDGNEGTEQRHCVIGRRDTKKGIYSR